MRLLVAAHGFEPRTHRVWTDCSSQLSYAAKYMELVTGIEPVTLSLPRIRSADWATPAHSITNELTWLRGQDLSLRPSGYEPDELPTAPPRDKNGGGRRIRTFEVEDGRFTVCSLWPLGNPSKKMELAIGIEPTTCWLQVSCSTDWATPAHLHISLYMFLCNLSRTFFYSVVVFLTTCI